MKTGVLLAMLAAGSLSAQVTFDRILHADREPQNWLTYSGSLASDRYSELTQITPENVKNLELKWVYQPHSLERYEATPLVVDGIMYTIQNPNDVVAIDAASGKVFWTFSHRPSAQARNCCGRLSRGLAILGDTLYLGTLDAHLIAIDAQSGRQIWDVQVANPAEGYAITHAPLIVKDKVLVGMAGGEYGIRGFLAAFDARTGKEVWRFHTVPAKGEPGNETWTGESWEHGGGSIWMTGSYDPELNLTYWGIGNPGPDWNGDTRAGDNLYTSSVVALDADTGKLKWYYQFTPHDEFDWDSVQVPVLADMDWTGKDGQTKPRKVMLWANRNGMMYVLDRTNGEFLRGQPFTKVNWADGFDDKGQIRVRANSASKEGIVIFPGNQGGTNWYSPSYSPRTGLFYIPAWDNYSTVYQKTPAEYKEGKMYIGGKVKQPGGLGVGFGAPNFRRQDEGYGAVRAFDPKTGLKKWEYKMTDVIESGILTTASDVLFSGGAEGYFFALDARNGGLLWKSALGSSITSGPMTYSVNGKQYVSVIAGHALFTFGLR